MRQEVTFKREDCEEEDVFQICACFYRILYTFRDIIISVHQVWKMFWEVTEQNKNRTENVSSTFILGDHPEGHSRNSSTYVFKGVNFNQVPCPSCNSKNSFSIQ